jgi:Uma2 family endonuclease
MIAASMPGSYDALMPYPVPARPESLPAPLRFTRADFNRMGEAGLFEGRRVELLEGEVIEMTPQGSRHASAVARIASRLGRVLDPSFVIRPQLPLALDDRSEPEPDIAVCRPDPRDYADAHPRADQVVLLVEVADSSLGYDHGRKAAAYARAGIPVLWIVDLQARAVSVLREPGAGSTRFKREQRLSEGEALVLPDGQALPASEILPPA